MALVTRLGDDERVVFSDAVHPTDQIGPAHKGFVKDQKTVFRAGFRGGQLNMRVRVISKISSALLQKIQRLMPRPRLKCWKSWSTIIARR